jgi:hypothetical protein
MQHIVTKYRYRQITTFLFAIIFISSCTNSDLSNLKTLFPAPTNLKSEKLNANSVRLTWTSNSKGEEGFAIERTIVGTSDIVKSTVGPNTTEWVDNTVTAATYKYTVYAYFKSRKSGSISIIVQHIPLNTPTNFKISGTASTIELSWDAMTGTFDGFRIEKSRNNGLFSLWKTVDKNTTQIVDNEPAVGKNTYRLYAFSGALKSEPIESSTNYIAAPQITINNLLTSYLKLTPNFTLTSDGGEACTVGVCWSNSPSPTIENSKSDWHVKLNSAQKAFCNATNLESGLTYYLRAYATNSKFTSYSNEVSGKLDIEPQPIMLDWIPMAAVNSNLPPEIKVYETASTLNGRNFKAYYTIADMSTGNIELKTFFSSTAKKPSKFITDATSETVYAMTNAGYFGYNGSVAVSYSLVVDRGQKLADNIGSLTRGSNIYAVTRGAFGVTQNQIPSVKWAVGSFAYNIPSPNVEGETPQKSLSTTFPAVSENWNPYSAVGGAPVILKNGKIVFDFTTTATNKYMTNYELLQTDIFATSARPPRTVIGSTADNKIVLFVCDGRQTESDGATLLELAQIMKGLGCINAMNLDGGGSTAMIASGSLLNKPSDGSERAVASVVAFVKKK